MTEAKNEIEKTLLEKFRKLDDFSQINTLSHITFALVEAQAIRKQYVLPDEPAGSVPHKER